MSDPQGAKTMTDNTMAPPPQEEGRHMRRCSRCGRTFKTRRATEDHIRMKHHGNGKRIDARRPDREESLADISIDAEIKRLSGEPLDPLEESLLQ